MSWHDARFVAMNIWMEMIFLMDKMGMKMDGKMDGKMIWKMKLLQIYSLHPTYI